MCYDAVHEQGNLSTPATTLVFVPLTYSIFGLAGENARKNEQVDALRRFSREVSLLSGHETVRVDNWPIDPTLNGIALQQHGNVGSDQGPPLVLCAIYG